MGPTDPTSFRAQGEAPSVPLILASTSRYRQSLLARLHLPFEVRAPRCDEDTFKARATDPRALSELLALEKARSVAREAPHAFVIGSDQVVELDGEILGKPGSVEDAERQLARLGGRTHQLITSLAVLGPRGVRALHTDVTRMHMRALSEREIARYVARDQPLDCAGSYKIECLGIALFERIECADHTAITGLPLLALSALLRGLGFALP